MTIRFVQKASACLMLIVWACLTASPAVTAEEKKAEEYDSLAEALKEGKFAVSLRYRYEDVSDDAPAVAAKDAQASTLRSTLSYRSGVFKKFSVFGEFEDVTDLGLRYDHNNAGAGSLSNGVTDRPVIADPDMTEVNQVYLRYAGIPQTTITAGRQEIAFGTQRFVGPVGWRQNHQSFDAVRVGVQAIPRTELSYVFIDNVQRIFGDDKPMTSHLLDAEIKIGKKGRLTPYVYSLDYDELADAGSSTTTYGIRWQNAWDPDGPWSVPYQVEFAQQDDAGDNPSMVDAGYGLIELGGKRGPIWFKAGYEMLGGEVGKGAFGTPLATLHKFNGWADKFLGTPQDGLEDVYVAVGGSYKKLTGAIVYHDFASDTAGIDYGQEFDLSVSYKAAWKQVFGFKAATYNADQLKDDTTKLWFWTAYSWGG